MKRLLLGACHQVSKRDDKTLSASEYKALQKRYRTLLTQGARELPPIPPRQNGQRGKVAKSDAHNLWERMKKHETSVLRFAKHPDVAFTNNRAERDLRMSKVKRQASSRKSPDASAPASTPKPIAESQAICSPWPIRVTTRWWPSRSLSPAVPLKICPSSYYPRFYAAANRTGDPGFRLVVASHLNRDGQSEHAVAGPTGRETTRGPSSRDQRQTSTSLLGTRRQRGASSTQGHFTL